MDGAAPSCAARLCSIYRAAADVRRRPERRQCSWQHTAPRQQYMGPGAECQGGEGRKPKNGDDILLALCSWSIPLATHDALLSTRCFCCEAVSRKPQTEQAKRQQMSRPWQVLPRCEKVDAVPDCFRLLWSSPTLLCVNQVCRS
jgi:hypothetical protein